MGDASQALKKNNPFPSHSQSSPSADEQLQNDLYKEDAHPRYAVLYSHTTTSPSKLPIPRPSLSCSNFEELLLLLESDKIESIWFDVSVNAHERAYITGWSKIFRPDLTTHYLQHKEMTH